MEWHVHRSRRFGAAWQSTLYVLIAFPGFKLAGNFFDVDLFTALTEIALLIWFERIYNIGIVCSPDQDFPGHDTRVWIISE